MLYAFVDESYTADHFYLSAVVVREKNLNLLADAIRRAREYAVGFGVTEENIEFHGHSIMTGSDGWESIQGKFRAAEAIYRKALGELAQQPIRVFISGVDVTRLHARYSYPEPPYQVALKTLVETLNAFAASHGERLTIIADEVQDQALHAQRILTFQSNGTGGNWSSTLNSIEPPMLFASSQESPGIQSADLAVYLYRRIDAHLPADSRTHAAALELWETLRPTLHYVRRWDP